MNRRLVVLAATLGLAIPGVRLASASGEVVFGAQNWWQTVKEAKYQEFREQPNGAFVESFLVRGAIGRTAITGWGSNLFLAQQALGGSIDRGIKWQLDGSYSQLPHLFSQNARSPFTDIGGGNFLLSDSLQRANQDNPGGYIPRMNSELAVAPLIPLEHRSDIADARLRFRPSQPWQLGLKAERRSRAGSKAYSLSFGFSNTNEVVEPIDQDIVDVSTTANYTKGKLGVQVLAGYSQFQNNINALTVDNSRRATDSATLGSSRGRIDLYPDNQAVRTQADLHYSLGKRTQFFGTFGASRLTQNDPWLPFTVNTAFSQATLDSLYPDGRRSTDAKALRITHDYRVLSRLTKNIRGTLRFRNQLYDNQTGEFPFRGVVQYDQSLVRDTVGFHNHPYGNEQTVVGTDWDGWFGRAFNVTVSYDHRLREHTLREVENDTEDAVSGRAHGQLGDGGYYRLDGGYGHRTGDNVDVEEYQRPDQPDTVYVENPNLRRYDVANRDRTSAAAEVGWAIGERIDVSLNGDWWHDDYGDTRYGLQDDERWMLLGQATLAVTSGWDLTGGYGYGRKDTDQASQERSANATIPIQNGNLEAGTDWSAAIRDRNDYGFVQSTWRIVPRTFSIDASYWVSRDMTDYFLDNENATAVDLPSTYYLRQEGWLLVHYVLGDGTELQGRYGYDTWKVDDFAATDIPLLGVAGTPPAATAIYLGAGYRGYTAHSVAFAVSRRF
jgi:MtrB/PioB family decaheme-associated outer membrane protein